MKMWRVLLIYVGFWFSYSGDIRLSNVIRRGVFPAQVTILRSHCFIFSAIFCRSTILLVQFFRFGPPDIPHMSYIWERRKSWRPRLNSCPEALGCLQDRPNHLIAQGEYIHVRIPNDFVILDFSFASPSSGIIENRIMRLMHCDRVNRAG